MKFDPNIEQVKQSATLAINEHIKALRTQGKEFCHLGFGESPFAVPPRVEQHLRDSAHRKEYLAGAGLPELRQAISGYLKRNFSAEFAPEQIVVGPGSKELIFDSLYILQSLLLLPGPCWVSYGPQAVLLGKEHTVLHTQRSNNYKIQPDELDALCTKHRTQQKTLVLNSPNNPTGHAFSNDELKALAEVCRTHQITVISDEIYGLIQFSNAEPYPSIARYYPEGTFVTGGLSKAYSAGGYRLGFIAVPKEAKAFHKYLINLVSETFSCVSTPIQYAAVAAFDDVPEIRQYVNRCTRIHKATTHYLYQRFVQMGLSSSQPEGSFYLFPDFDNFRQKLGQKHGVHNSVSLCHALLDKFRVATLPGKDFCYPDDVLACRIAAVDYDGSQVLKAAEQDATLDNAFVEKHCPGSSWPATTWKRLFPEILHGTGRCRGFVCLRSLYQKVKILHSLLQRLGDRGVVLDRRRRARVPSRIILNYSQQLIPQDPEPLTDRASREHCLFRNGQTFSQTLVDLVARVEPRPQELSLIQTLLMPHSILYFLNHEVDVLEGFLEVVGSPQTQRVNR